jgi:ParB family chromosome partitioning protein
VRATLRPRGKGVSIDLSDKDAKSFGTWISDNLDSLYEAFRKAKQEN